LARPLLNRAPRVVRTANMRGENFFTVNYLRCGAVAGAYQWALLARPLLNRAPRVVRTANMRGENLFTVSYLRCGWGCIGRALTSLSLSVAVELLSGEKQGRIDLVWLNVRG
jgi:hypothetical protein